jgi:small subunit ribosomal protein S6
MEYTVNTEAINPLEIEMRRDERIMRFLTVKLDKFGVEYAARRKKRVKSKKEEA